MASARFLRRHKGGEAGHLLRKRPDVCHTAAGGEEGEHRLVVGGIPKENHLIPDGVVVRLPQDLLQKEPGHIQLVVIPKPGVDVDGADLCHRPQGLGNCLDLVGGLKPQVGRVLVKINGYIVDAGKLVLGDPAPRHPRQAGVPHRRQPPLDVPVRHRGVSEGEAAALPEVVDESPVFPHHSGHRPLADDEIAPAGRPPGNGNHPITGVVEPPKGGIGFGRELPAGGDGIVDVTEDIAEFLGALGLDAGKRLHSRFRSFPRFDWPVVAPGLIWYYFTPWRQGCQCRRCRGAPGVTPYPALKGLNPPEGESDCLES